jgi:hypothetical protein
VTSSPRTAKSHLESAYYRHEEIRHKPGSQKKLSLRATRGDSSRRNQYLGECDVSMTVKFAPLWFLGSLTVLSVFIPVTLISTTPDIGRSTAWQETLLILVYAGIRLSHLIARGEPRMFTFSWFLFAYIFMGLAPTVQIRTGIVPNTTPGMIASIDGQIVKVLIASFVAWEIGAALSRHADRRRTGSPRGPGRGAQPFSGAEVAWAAPSGLVVSRSRLRGVTAIAVLAVAFYVAKIGSASILAPRNVLELTRNSAFGDPTTRVVAVDLAIYLPVLVAQARRWLPVEGVVRVSRQNRTAIMTFAAISVLLGNPIGNARYVSGTILLSVLYLVGAFSSLRRSRWSFWVVIAGFIFIFPALFAFRLGTFSASRKGFFGEYAGNGDYDAFYQLGNALSYVASRGSDSGRQLLGVILFWIPRSIWSSKPIDTGTLLANFRGYSFGNLSAPIWAELIVNFGLVGLLIGIFFVGYVIARADVSARGATPTNTSFFRNSVMPFYLIILIRGSLLQAMAGFLTLLVFTYILSPRQIIPQPPGAGGGSRSAPPGVERVGGSRRNRRSGGGQNSA